MPITKSAKKALRQNIRRRARNLAHKKKIKDTLKKYKQLIAAGKRDEAKSFLPQVYKVLDKMAKVNFIKEGKADRLKSRFTKKLT